MLNLHKLRGLAIAAGIFAASTAALSQDGYHISEDYQPDAATANAGPVRMARISYLTGNVSWRPSGDVSWSDASVNLPLRQGAQIWVNDHARAEIQFDDGSYMRIGNVSSGEGGLATLQTLYSDSKGEFTEIALSSGLASFHLVNNQSLYQVDTQTLTAKAYGFSKFRVGESGGVEVVDKSGEVVVENGDAGKVALHDQQSVYAADANSGLQVANAPEPDRWDAFVDERDQVGGQRSSYLPQNLAIAAGNLDSYGSWHAVGSYGNVWVPTQEASWRPYSAGHWVWVSPFGWTWCGNEAWGWAPYHYGTWVSTSYGWGWSPGPARQCWSPAVVHFTQCEGQVAWCPLAPSEVHYAALSVGGPGWSLSFSIGSVGCYYPSGLGYCEPRTINNVVVNRTTNVYNVTVINNNYGHFTAVNDHFVPLNSRTANGGSVVAVEGFGRGGQVSVLDRSKSGLFERGQSFSASGGHYASGPPNVQVNNSSFVPTHTFGSNGPPARVTDRSILRRNLPEVIQSHTTKTGVTFHETAPKGVAPRVGDVSTPIKTGGSGTPAPTGWRRTDGTGSSRDGSLRKTPVDPGTGLGSGAGAGGGSKGSGDPSHAGSLGLGAPVSGSTGHSTGSGKAGSNRRLRSGSHHSGTGKGSGKGFGSAKGSGTKKKKDDPGQ